MRNTLFLYLNYCITSFVAVSVLQLSYSVLTEDAIAVCVCVCLFMGNGRVETPVQLPT